MPAFNTKVPEIRTIGDAQHHAKDWLFNHAAPLWGTVGVCSDGQFAERLTLSGEFVDMPRRTMVQARQIYSFIAAGELGWAGPWKVLVEKAMTLLLERGLQDGSLFVHQFDETGNVIDPRLDLYDHAFGLFALAHAGRALGRPDYFAIANKVMDRMDTEWRRPEGGFWEGQITPCPPYRQNPHMHMFEAAYALHEATGGERWQTLMRDLLSLFQSKFQNARTGAVTEYFDINWDALEDSTGSIVEPGHCMEWAWLFETAFSDLSGVPVATKLTNFARGYGICPDRGVAINEVSLDGSIIDGNARLWPQTERLKAAVARYRRLKTEEEAEEVVAAYRGLVPYFQTPCPGTWYDRWMADGSWMQQDAPASSFYHITCGLKELMSCSSEL